MPGIVHGSGSPAGLYVRTPAHVSAHPRPDRGRKPLDGLSASLLCEVEAAPVQRRHEKPRDGLVRGAVDRSHWRMSVRPRSLLVAFRARLLAEVLDAVGHPDGAGEELTHPRLAGGLVYHQRGVMLVVGDRHHIGGRLPVGLTLTPLIPLGPLVAKNSRTGSSPLAVNSAPHSGQSSSSVTTSAARSRRFSQPLSPIPTAALHTLSATLQSPN